jgi:hypothetical protein
MQSLITIAAMVVCLGLAVAFILWVLTWSGLLEHRKHARGFDVKLTGRPVGKEVEEERD